MNSPLDPRKSFYSRLNIRPVTLPQTTEELDRIKKALRRYKTGVPTQVKLSDTNISETVFSGSDLTNWVHMYFHYTNRADSVEVCRFLLGKKLFKGFNGNRQPFQDSPRSFYTFYDDAFDQYLRHLPKEQLEFVYLLMVGPLGLRMQHEYSRPLQASHIIGWLMKRFADIKNRSEAARFITLLTHRRVLRAHEGDLYMYWFLPYKCNSKLSDVPMETCGICKQFTAIVCSLPTMTLSCGHVFHRACLSGMQRHDLGRCAQCDDQLTNLTATSELELGVPFVTKILGSNSFHFKALIEDFAFHFNWKYAPEEAAQDDEHHLNNENNETTSTGAGGYDSNDEFDDAPVTRGRTGSEGGKKRTNSNGNNNNNKVNSNDNNNNSNNSSSNNIKREANTSSESKTEEDDKHKRNRNGHSSEIPASEIPPTVVLQAALEELSVFICEIRDMLMASLKLVKDLEGGQEKCLLTVKKYVIPKIYRSLFSLYINVNKDKDKALDSRLETLRSVTLENLGLTTKFRLSEDKRNTTPSTLRTTASPVSSNANTPTPTRKIHADNPTLLAPPPSIGSSTSLTAPPFFSASAPMSTGTTTPGTTAVGEEVMPYQEAIQAFQMVREYTDVYDKLNALMLTSHFIVEGVRQFWKGNPEKPEDLTLTADEMISITCYVVCKAQIPHLVSEEALIEDFMDEMVIYGEAGYCLTTLSMVISFLATTELSELLHDKSGNTNKATDGLLSGQ